MTERTKQHLTVAGVVGGLALLGSSIGGLVSWTVDTNKRMGVATSVTDSLFYNDSVQTAEIERIKRHLGIKGSKRKLHGKGEDVGLARKLWRAIF